MVETALYRHFDESGRLLYVGISLQPVNRLVQHGGKSHWARTIARVTIEWLPDRPAAAAAELRAIAAEKPLHNIVGKNRQIRDDQPAETLKPAPAPEWVERPEEVAVRFKISMQAVVRLIKAGWPREKAPNGRWRYDITAWKARGYAEAEAERTERLARQHRAVDMGAMRAALETIGRRADKVMQ